MEWSRDALGVQTVTVGREGEEGARERGSVSTGWSQHPASRGRTGFYIAGREQSASEPAGPGGEQ